MGMESFGNNEKAGETGFHGKEANPRISLQYGEYNQGDLVSVLRSDGTLEKDWTFHHQRMDTAEIVVTKMINGKMAKKEMPPDIFDKMQQEN